MFLIDNTQKLTGIGFNTDTQEKTITIKTVPVSINDLRDFELRSCL